jgi:hypothetical protein
MAANSSFAIPSIILAAAIMVGSQAAAAGYHYPRESHVTETISVRQAPNNHCFSPKEAAFIQNAYHSCDPVLAYTCCALVQRGVTD